MGIIMDILKDIPLSAVLRERLVDQETKMAVLQRENASIKAENTVLKQENADLRLAYQKAQEQIRAHEHQIEQPIAEVHGKTLPKEQQDVLLLLLKNESEESKLASSLGRGLEAVRFDLVELAQSGFIKYEHVAGLGMYCSLTQDGRRYLKVNKLLI